MITFHYLSGHSLGLSGTGSETVLESSRNVLQVSLTTGSSGLASGNLETPVESSGLSGRVSAAGAGLLLAVEGSSSASLAQSVRLVVSLTETGGTLCWLVLFFINHKN